MKQMSEMTKVSVPVGVVRELERTPGGINPIIDDLRRKHLVKVNYDGKCLELLGDNEDILDMANEFLHVKVDRATPTNKALGGEGTVAWTYRGKPVKYIQNVLHAERKELLKVKSIKTAQPTVDSLTISCRYEDYQTANEMLEKLDKKIKKCKEKSVEVDTKDLQLAKKFEKDSTENSFYCCLNVNKNDKSKVELEFYGREERDCQEGISVWESIKQGDKKKPTSSSTTTKNLNENESGKDNSKLQQYKTTSQQGITNSKPTTATATLNSKHAANTKDSDRDETTPGSSNTLSSKDTITMDADWDDNLNKTTTATASISKDSTKLWKVHSPTSDKTKSQSDSKPSNHFVNASASGGSKESMQPHATRTVKKTPGRIKGYGEAEKYTFQIENMQVFVYKQSITEIRGMDAITNAANERLMHAGGVAYYISKAAGKKMDSDCSNYIAKNGSLQVTQNFVSIPGDIKCKGIIHAVGPTWYDYNDKREDCARDLYETIKNVLVAADRRKWQKIALSAISSGLFGVPKKLCAEMYIKAFADFVTEADGNVKEVHFIDLNPEILDLVIDAHKIWLKDESKLDFKNALEYTSAVSKRQTRKGSGSEEQESLIQSLGTDKTSYGETRYKYRICKKLAVFVYKGSLTRLETVDAIALTIDPNPNYRSALEHSVRTLAGPKYSTEVDKFRNGKNGRVFVLSGSGSLRCKFVVHIIPSPSKGVGKDICFVLSEVYSLGLTFSYKSKIRSLSMPLFGAGGARSKADIQVLCQTVIQTLVCLCSDSSTTLKVEELHLVNLERTVSVCLQEEFTRFSNDMRESKGMKAVDKYDSQTKKGFSCYTPWSYTGHHQWIQHTPLEDSKSGKAKPANESKGKTKELQGKASVEVAPSDGKCIYCDIKAKIKVKECNHMYCPACAVSIETSGICLKCPTSSKETTVNSKNADEPCPICLEPPKNAEVLPCSHTLCRTCYEAVKKQKPQCPICQHIFGDVKGTQPDGDMFYRHVTQRSLPGYDGCGTIEIYYIIPSGKQEKCHPHPGKPYRGIERRAYLPDNKEGKEILHLLRRAFDRKLVFTIGESRTTGKEGVVTWNDIHHKTRPYGGPEKFGYPDPTYLTRVKEELAAKGVTQ